MNSHYRQGDVYISKLSESLDLGEPHKPEPRGTVLAYGEVTGHAHTLDPTKAQLFDLPDHLKSEIPEAANGRILRVLEPVSLKHEEHGDINLEPGDYYVGIQIEYDDMEEWRRVAD